MSALRRKPLFFAARLQVHALMWRFGRPRHCRGKLVKRTSEPTHARIIGLLVFFESEIRNGSSRKLKRISDSEH
jgi:hypothetical protein